MPFEHGFSYVYFLAGMFGLSLLLDGIIGFIKWLASLITSQSPYDPHNPFEK